MMLTCRYNYTVWQDTLNGRQLSTRDGVEAVLEILDTVRAAWSSLSFAADDIAACLSAARKQYRLKPTIALHYCSSAFQMNVLLGVG